MADTQYLRLALPSVVMVSEGWTGHVCVLLAATLTHRAYISMKVFAGIASICFAIGLGLSVATCTRVAACLGAGG